MDERLYVWLIASIRTELTRRWALTSQKEVKLYFEADPRQTNKEPKFVEVRIDITNMRMTSRNDYEVDVEINLLVQTQETPNELYAHQKLTGASTSILQTDINLKEIGFATNTNANIGCLQIERGVDISELGQVTTDTKVQQATVEAHYRFRS